MGIPEPTCIFSSTPEGPKLVQCARLEKTYFLFGLIPIWHVSEEHRIHETPGRWRGAEPPEAMD